MKNRKEIEQQYRSEVEKNYTENQKKEYFEDKGFITDVVVPVLRDGEKNKFFTFKRESIFDFTIKLNEDSDENGYIEVYYTLSFKKDYESGKTKIILEHYPSGKASFREVDVIEEYYNQKEMATTYFCMLFEGMLEEIIKRLIED